MTGDIVLSTRNLDRRVAELMALPKDFQKRLTTVQNSLKCAYARLQADVKESVNPSGTLPVDFFLAQAVLTILKQNSERAVFWGYTGDTGMWEKLVLVYQRKCLWTAEAAQQIMWCTEYELPRLKKQALVYDQKLQALSRRRGEASKSSQGAFEQYMCDCGQASLAGNAVERELAFAIAKLPLKTQAVLSSLQHKDVRKAIESYSGLFLAREDGNLGALHEFLSAQCKAQVQETPTVVHNLCSRHVGAVCTTIKLSMDSEIRISQRGDASDDADHGLIDANSGLMNDMSMKCDNDAAAVTDSGQARKWNIFIAASGVAAPSTGGIQSTVADDENFCHSPGEPEIEGTHAAQRLAFDADFRARLVADLHELHGYLMQRSNGQESISAIPGLLPDKVQSLNYEMAKSAQGCLAQALDTLQNPEVVLLLRAAGSQAFADRYISKLKLHLNQSQKLSARAMELKREEERVRASLAELGSVREENRSYLDVACQHLQAALTKALKRTVVIAH